MNTPLLNIKPLLSAAALGFLSSTATLHSAILVSESFNYADGTAITNGNGGTGFSGANWTVATSTGNNAELADHASYQSGSIQIGNGTANPLGSSPSLFGAISRGVNLINNNVVYVRFTFSTGAGTLNDGNAETTNDLDRLFLQLDGNGDTNGWGTFEIGMGLNTNQASNTSGATPDNNLTIRTNSVNQSTAQPGRRSTAANFQDLTVYTIVAELSKTVEGATSPYSYVRLWINPTEDSYASTVVSGGIRSTGTLYDINTLRLRIDETEDGDQYLIHDLAITDTFEQAVSMIPESSSFALIGGLAALAFGSFSRRRTNR